MNSSSALASNIPMTQSMFWKPNYLARSAWFEHLPFAFWITDAHRPQVFVELGTHSGASYFAFCQAVSQLGLDARCYAVDTWKGDEHAGFYGEEIFTAVQQENEARYSAFSRLVRSTFDEAIEYFEDGSIDLLHIDGHHSYESVKANFEQWKCKLSPRGLVLFHDTNVRERHFGVFRLLEELRQSYPVFDFTHGHGLGCVAVGPEQNDAVRALLAADKSDDARRDVRAIFSCLGDGCLLAYQKASLESREAAAKTVARGLEAKLKDVTSSVDEVKRELADRTRERDEARQEILKMTEATAFERGVLTQQLEGLRAGQQQAVSGLEETRRQIASFHQEYVSSRLAQAQREDESLLSFKSRIGALDAFLDEGSGRVEALQNEVRSLTRALVEKEQELEAERELKHGQFEALSAERSSLASKLEQAEKALLSLQDQVEKDQDTNQQKLERANARARQLQASLDKRFQEVATLTKMLQETAARVAEQAERQVQHGQIEALGAERSKLESKLKATEKTLAGLQAQLQKAQDANQQKLEQANAKTQQLQDSLDARFQEIATLTKMLQDLSAVTAGEDERNTGEGRAVATPPAPALAAVSAENVVNPGFFKLMRDAARRALPGHKVQRLPEAEEVLASGLFDKNWYCAQYGVSRKGDQALDHFMLHAAQGHSPGPDFDSEAYFAYNPDVREAGLNPLLHYQRHGKLEQRRLK